MVLLDKYLSDHQESFELEEEKSEMKKHPMYDLKVNEEYIVQRTCHEGYVDLIIRRVPSGWIYEYFTKFPGGKVESSVFVPYTDSYMYGEEL